MFPVKVYCANLPERKDRRKHIEREFKDRLEFDLNIMPAIKNETDGAKGLYQTFLSILEIKKKE